ncbi:MAG: response regulator [Limisphaerales bacterium]
MSKRILLVDDECSIREALSKILRGENYEVVLAENGEQAIERNGAGRIDLLLLDLNLPVKNGWATLEWLAEVNPLLPVIIITGRSEQRALAEKAGADALMEKPLDVPCLLQTIRELLDETMESRVRRASDRSSGFRYAPSDDQQFREMLLKRFTTPYSCLGYEKRILVVDDDGQIRESLRKVLQAEDYEVVLAADGQEGIGKFASEPIDLLLLDLNLPAKSGWDIFERLSFMSPLLPIIIITGRHNQYEMAKAAGVGALMEKPLDVPLLLQTITELLAEPAETRLERLAGLHSYVRHVTPCHSPPPGTP